jgi:hypothetical protein
MLEWWTQGGGREAGRQKGREARRKRRDARPLYLLTSWVGWMKGLGLGGYGLRRPPSLSMCDVYMCWWI